MSVLHSKGKGSKRKAVRELEKKCPGATLIESGTSSVWDIEIEAPKGRNWGGEVHAYVVHWHFGGPKSAFWDAVIEEIKALPEAVNCDNLTCNSWVDGECELWSEDDHDCSGGDPFVPYVFGGGK